jgi:putative membrane protein
MGDAHGGEGSLTVIAALAVLTSAFCAYLYAAYGEPRKAVWSGWRTASFAFGLSLIAIAILPPIAASAHIDLRGHMLQHLLLGMFAPLGLVMGAPVTLTLRALPTEAARTTVALLAARPIRVLTHPVTAAILDMGGMYLLYLTPLYVLSMDMPIVHGLIQVHFLISGSLFVWSIAGPDPAPHRPSMRTRLAVLFLATAAHATLAKLMYAYGFPRGTHHSLAEIEAAAQTMYYGGDLAELLLAVAFFAGWLGPYGRNALRLARPAH